MKDINSKDLSLDPPPSYSESIDGQSFLLHSLPPTTTKIGFNLISSLLTTHIHPHLHRPTLGGPSRRTLVLIPSNVSSLQPIPTVLAEPGSYLNPFEDPANNQAFIHETVIGFPATENPLLIRLHGNENTLEFWHQDNVIRDLETRLKAELSSVGHRVEETHQSNCTRGALSDRAEWRAVSEQALEAGEVRVGIRIREVSLRVENVMGLYETRGGKAIVVRVEFGG